MKLALGVGALLLVLAVCFQNWSNTHSQINKYQERIILPAKVSEISRGGIPGCERPDQGRAVYRLVGINPDARFSLNLRVTYGAAGNMSQSWTSLQIPASVGNCATPADPGTLQICGPLDMNYLDVEMKAEGGLVASISSPPSRCGAIPQEVEFRVENQ
jgi:hypothetical protein